MMVPFAFALAALITRQFGEKWISITRRWTMVTGDVAQVRGPSRRATGPTRCLAGAATGEILDKAAARQSQAETKKAYTLAFEEALRLYNVSPRSGWERQTNLSDVAAQVMSKEHGYFVVGINAPRYNGNHAAHLHFGR